MKPFLQQLAEEIAIRYGDDPGQVCVVLPNRRAGLYLKKYLARELKKTAWSPVTYSVEDFIITLSGVRIIDPAGLLFEFYQVYREIQGDKAQDFELFSDWAQVLLQDFDELDQYLLEPEKIFHFLDEARALSVWNLNESPLTEQEKSYVEFYRSFLDYYLRLRQLLTKKKQVYQGLAYRMAAENISVVAPGLPWKKIFFAGLNALSAAESKIIDHLVSKNKAELFWDADVYYIDDKSQEAGNFIRDHLAKWASDKVKWIGNDFMSMEKKISIMGVPGSTGQVQKAGQIIRDFKSSQEEPDRTALVLADEKLLIPLLYSLPDDIGPVNVTMGYPFRLTQLYQLVSLLLQMHENAEKFSAQRKNSSGSFYVKDILKLLSHPYFLLFEPEQAKDKVSFNKIRQILRNSNRVFVRQEELAKLAIGMGPEAEQLIAAGFSDWNNPEIAMEKLLAILGLIRDRIIAESKLSPAEYELDLEFLFHLSGIIRRTNTMLEEYPVIKTVRTLRKIIIQLLDSSRLPFTGEPLRGLQVMGVLETRAVDFENLVVLSVNEGILPSGRLPNSFIPFDIKSAFGLPTFQHKDAVFAYHFYRMLQRARNIYLLYDTEGDQMKGGEKSRFIMQLAYEFRKYNPLTVIEEELVRPNPPESGQVNPVIIKKSPAVMERLMAKTATGFSPTAFNHFIKCPLRFYFQEILGISEAETVEETIEAKTMGTVIHQVLQKVFEPFTGRAVDADALFASMKETEKLTREAFREHYHEGDLEHGKNHLIFKVSLFLVNQLISAEAETLKPENHSSSSLTILSLEERFEHTIECKAGNQPVSVRIKGLTDRIDRQGNIVRIIDYKTGAVDARALDLKSWDQLILDPEKSKAFQLLVYGWLYYKNRVNTGDDIQAGNISLRKVSNGFMKVTLPEGTAIDDESMPVFEGQLIKLLEDILDPMKDFIQTEEVQNCVNCPFTAICTR
jgi:ATP-dependent helicase/nuclease subunit B